jgi:hypothetical protein
LIFALQSLPRFRSGIDFADRAPFVRTVRCRTVANTLRSDLMSECSAGKSKKASSVASRSFVRQFADKYGAKYADFTFCRVVTGLAGWGGGIRTSAFQNRNSSSPLRSPRDFEPTERRVVALRLFRGLTANIEWHPIASSSMLGCAANQQQYSPENDWLSGPTERHCCGMIEGLGPSGILPRRLFRQCGASVVTARDAAVNRTEIRSCRRKAYRYAVGAAVYRGPALGQCRWPCRLS